MWRRRTDGSYYRWSLIVAWLSLWASTTKKSTLFGSAEGNRWGSTSSSAGRTRPRTTTVPIILGNDRPVEHNDALQLRVLPGARRRGVLELNVRGGSSSLQDDDDEEEEEEYDENEDEEDEQEEEDENDEQEEDDEEEKDESSDNDGSNNVVTVDESSSTMSLLLTVLSKTAVEVVQSTVQIVGRVVAAAMESPPTQEEETTLTQHILGTIQRMLRAALDASSSSSSSSKDATPTTKTTRKHSGNSRGREQPTKCNDAGLGENGSDSIAEADSNEFGIQLANLYQVKQSRYNTIDTDDDDDDDVADGSSSSNSDMDLAPVLGGSLKDALQSARDQARLLVVLLPASQPPKIRPNDVEALTSFLSSSVARVCEKRPKTTKSSSSRDSQTTTTGSFLLWSATAGSTHATVALKRLRGLQQSSRSHAPVLAVVYPNLATTGALTAKVLAQHHCSPPLSASKMASWLKAIQKRHGPLYRKLQQERQEQIWARERVAGYVGSVQADREQQARAERWQEEERARQVAAAAHEAAVTARRTRLQNAMTDEPPATLANVKTIALRLADGRTGKRRFAPAASLAEIFNWVDAEFALERETITLVTLNGQQSFEWLDNKEDANDKPAMPTLQDAGLGKMVGFRVLEKKSKQNGTQDDKDKPS